MPEIRSNRLTCSGIPHACYAIGAAGQQRPAIRRELNGRNHVVYVKLAHGLAVRGVPQPHLVVDTASHKDTAVACEQDIIQGGAVEHSRSNGLPRRGVPNTRLAVGARSQHKSIVGRICDRSNLIAVLHWRADSLTGARVPDLCDAIGASGQDSTAIGAKDRLINDPVMFKDCSQGCQLNCPRRQVGSCQICQIGSLGRCLP